MKLVAENFSRNGHNSFRGTVKAIGDDGLFTGWTDVVNIYSRKEKLKLVDNLHNDLFLALDKARAMVNELTKELEAIAQAAEALPDEDNDKKSQATQLVDLAVSEQFELWHAPDSTAFATIEVDGHSETWAINSKSFRQRLSFLFYQKEAKTPGNQAVADALSVIGGKAVFEGQEYYVYLRVAEVDDTIYLDLANDDWEVVKITASGWEIVSEAPVRFRRARGMLPLPAPVKGGKVQRLRELLNLTGDDEGWSLLLACLVQALRGYGPYPIVVIHGQHGSAKSTTERVYKRLIDPNKADLRSPPKDERDISIQAGNGWVIAYDNLSRIPEWLSNSLCRLSTGGGMGTRELYSDDEERIFEGQRPIILNGIGEISNRPDLLDRAVVIALKPITKKNRKSERRFWRDFDAAHGEILGGLLDGVVVGLRNLGNVHLEELPRMADFAIWATAAETGLGMESGTFMAAYDSNREQANETTLEASPVATYIREFAALQGDWTGMYTALLTELEKLAEEKDRKHKSWPNRASILSNKVQALAPNLRAVGIEISQGRDLHRRWVRVQIISEDTQITMCPEKSVIGVIGVIASQPYLKTSENNDADNVHDAEGASSNLNTASYSVIKKPEFRSCDDANDANDANDALSADHYNGPSHNFENVCLDCGRSVPDLEIARYLDAAGQVVCQHCDDGQ